MLQLAPSKLFKYHFLVKRSFSAETLLSHASMSANDVSGQVVRKGFYHDLNEYDKAVAKDELHEDPSQVKSHIATLCGWVKQQKHFTCPMTDDYLLMFLRQAKFSQTRAREVLENFTKNRVTDPYRDIYINKAKLDPKVDALLQQGLCFVLPNLQTNGVRTGVFLGNKYNPDEFSFRDVLRACMLNMEIALLDPATQIHGVQWFIDQEGVGMKYIAQMSPRTMQIAAVVFMNTLPSRFKGVHFYRSPTIIAGVIAILRKCVSAKAAARINNYRDEATLVKAMDKEILPNEYGGQAGPMKELVKQWNNHVQSKLTRLDMYKYVRYDESMAGNQQAAGSFRKIATD